jgi:L-ascorbate metabolism protein UlaG (beta-lactamase superfamily)
MGARVTSPTSRLPGPPYAGPVAPSAPLDVQWLGHATALIELGGVRVLTDPALTPRLAHLRRHRRVDPATIGRPDIVLISHLHMDHLHVPSLRLVGEDVPIVVPAGAAGLIRRRGFRHVEETRSGETFHLGPLSVETVPAVHPGRRGPHSRLAADAVGYVLRAGGRTVYFPGDTDLFDEMGSWGPVDVALLPIWGWGRTLGEGHLTPRTAVDAVELIEPELVVPIHWGTYAPVGVRRQPPGWLAAPVHQFEAALAGNGEADRLRVLGPGDELILPGSPAWPGAPLR